MKLSLLLVPLPLAAVLLVPHGPDAPVGPPETRITGEESAEERACSAANARLGDETVRLPWMSLGVVHDDVAAYYCVFRGDPDSPLAFMRDAERVLFSLVGTGDQPKEAAIGFRITTSTGRTITIDPLDVYIAPRNRRSCRVEICTAFTEPGERIASVQVLTD